MSTVTTTKVIDLGQLAQELGDASLGMVTSAGESIITATVDQATLDAAVAAHVAPDYAAREANEKTLRQRAADALAGNATFLAIASPTNAQAVAQIKALTRQNNALIRLAIRAFDATD